MMKSPFEQWLEANRQQLVDWYCEGTMVDKDLLTRIEEFAQKAYWYAYDKGYEDGQASGVKKSLFERLKEIRRKEKCEYCT